MDAVIYTQKLIDENEKSLQNKALGSVERQLTEACIRRLKQDLEFFRLWR